MVTWSELGRRAVEQAIRTRSGGWLRGIKGVVPLGETESKWAGPVAWQIEVAPGRERTVLQQLEYRAANALASQGRYGHLGRRVKLEMARRVVVANQVRQVRLTQFGAGIPSAQVKLDDDDVRDVHAANRQLLIREEPTKSVEVAIFDSAVQFEHLPAHVRDRVSFGDVGDDRKAFTPGAHGAVTASIIGDLAPTATIRVFPIAAPNDVSGKEIHGESLVITSLMTTRARVIAMCLDLPERSRLAKQSEKEPVKRLIESIPTKPVVIVAAGNAPRPKKLDLHFPATVSNVVAVGAVNTARKRSSFSSYKFAADDQPGLFLVAPGGDREGRKKTGAPIKVGTEPFVGTSVAAAYAAGVVARWLGTPARAATVTEQADLFAVLAAAANKSFGPALECGEGLICQPPPIVAVPAAP